MQLKFYVPKEMKELRECLVELGFHARSTGKALPGEIAFFEDASQNGFCFSAHKFLKEEIPPEVADTPFLVKTGNRWTEEGLIHVVTGYAGFMMPCLQGRNGSELIQLCETCISLPWGSMPQGKNKQLLIKWLYMADKCFPRDNIFWELITQLIRHKGIKKLRTHFRSK